MQKISTAEAKKLVLNAQGIHREKHYGKGKAGCNSVIDHLGYIQIDTISVIERAHHHTLWSRVDGYEPDHLAQLQAEKKVFEYWSHAAAYLPMKDFRFSLPRKMAIASGEKHWYKRDVKLNKRILDRVRKEGAMRAREFENTANKSTSDWGGGKPAKRSLEQLFMEGELMVVGREGFQKIYDLSERVLPAGVDTSMPSTDQHLDHLIHSYLRANGIATGGQMSYLLKGMKPLIEKRCRELCEDRRLQQVELNQIVYYAEYDIDERLKLPSSHKKMKILSPFDNLLIQRERMSQIFSYEYQIECYVPAAKRKFGYFCLPILLGQNFVGRLDAKVERKTQELHIKRLYLNDVDLGLLLPAWERVIKKFMALNSAEVGTLEYLEINGSEVTGSTRNNLQKAMS